jgi:excisionase family DNA binding protein
MMTETKTIDRLALTYREASDALGVSERTVWSLVASKQLRAARIGRCVRIPRAELERFLSERAGVKSPLRDVA